MMGLIIAKKTGRWAQDEPGKPQIVLVDGQKYSTNQIPQPLLSILLDKGFVAPFAEKDVSRESTPQLQFAVVAARVAESASVKQLSMSVKAPPLTTTHHTHLRDELKMLVEMVGGGQDGKQALEDWGKKELGVNLDKRKSIKKLISELVRVAKNDQ